jgi:hypothetical protein
MFMKISYEKRRATQYSFFITILGCKQERLKWVKINIGVVAKHR